MLEIIEIKIAPKKADQKPVIVIFSVIRSVTNNIAVFTTSSERPNDKNAKGRVRTFKSVPKVAFINANIRAITK